MPVQVRPSVPLVKYTVLFIRYILLYISQLPHFFITSPFDFLYKYCRFVVKFTAKVTTKRMASIRKRGKKWLAEVRIKRGGYSSRSFSSKIEAKTWAAEEENRISRRGDLIRGKILDDACIRYMKEVAPTHKGHAWEIKRINFLMRDPDLDQVFKAACEI